MTATRLVILFTEILIRKKIISMAIFTVTIALVLNQSIFILIYSIASLTILNLKYSFFSLALSRAVIETFATLAAFWAVLSMIGLPFQYSQIIFFILISLRLLRHTDSTLPSKLYESINPMAYFGLLIFLIFTLFGDIAYGGNLSWAMAGDSRNHINWILTVAEANGMVETSYPYLPHGLMASLLLIFGEGNIFQIQELIFTYSRFWLLISILLSLISALIVIDLRLRSRLLTSMSLLVIGIATSSSLLLENSIENGFLPTVLTALLLVALIPEFLYGDGISRIVITTLAAALTLLTFPILALAGFFSAAYFTTLFIGPKVLKRHNLFEPILVSLFAVISYVLLKFTPEFIRETLSLNGRVAGVGISISVIFIFIILASNLLNLNSRCNFDLVIFAIFLAFNLLILSFLTDRFSYYFVKSLWIITSVLAVVSIIAVTLYASERRFKFEKVSSLLLLTIIALITNVPIKYQSGNSPAFLKLTNGGDLISPEMGDTILRLIEKDPRSISWNLYPTAKQQVTNIWESIGYGDEAEIFFWSYSGDVTSLHEVCGISNENSPSTIFVSNESISEYVAVRCMDKGIIVAAISEVE